MADRFDPNKSGSSVPIRTKNPSQPDELRAELVQWRSAIDPDGRPKQLSARGLPLWPVVAQQVVRLLDHVPAFQTSAVLADLERHLRWLSTSRARSPWTEASLIETLGCGAVLIRDSKVLQVARERLQTLLNRQTDEGWFPERGGADMGRLSLVLEALAPLWCDHGWDELRTPLEKAVQFLGILIDADAADVPCINTRGTGYIAPFGLERLAMRLPNAAHVAALLRSRFSENTPNTCIGWDDERTAVLGTSIALTATWLRQQPPSSDPVLTKMKEADSPGRTAPREDVEFPGAALHLIERPAYRAAIASGRGGSFFIRWSNGRTLEDAGITVVFPHTVRTSSRPGMSDPTLRDADALAWRGLLTRVRRRHPGIILQVWRWLVRLLLRRRWRSVTARFHTDGARGRQRLLHDWFSREIKLGESEVCIRDQVLCRLPCETVLVGDACGPAAKGRRWTSIDNAPNQAPVIVEGGRTVAITRTYRDGILVNVAIDRQVDMV